MWKFLLFEFKNFSSFEIVYGMVARVFHIKTNENFNINLNDRLNKYYAKKVTRKENI